MTPKFSILLGACTIRGHIMKPLYIAVQKINNKMCLSMTDVII